MHICIPIEKDKGYVLIFISHYLAVEVGVKNIEFVVVCPLVFFFFFLNKMMLIVFLPFKKKIRIRFKCLEFYTV